MNIILFIVYAGFAAFFFYKYMKLKFDQSKVDKTLSGIATVGFLFLTLKQVIDMFV